jgi:hypothetical protein
MDAAWPHPVRVGAALGPSGSLVTQAAADGVTRFCLATGAFRLTCLRTFFESRGSASSTRKPRTDRYRRTGRATRAVAERVEVARYTVSGLLALDGRTSRRHLQPAWDG